VSPLPATLHPSVGFPPAAPAPHGAARPQRGGAGGAAARGSGPPVPQNHGDGGWKQPVMGGFFRDEPLKNMWQSWGYLNHRDLKNMWQSWCYLRHFGVGCCHFNGICNIFEFEPLVFDGICNMLVLEMFM